MVRVLPILSTWNYVGWDGIKEACCGFYFAMYVQVFEGPVSGVSPLNVAFIKLILW